MSFRFFWHRVKTIFICMLGVLWLLSSFNSVDGTTRLRMQFSSGENSLPYFVNRTIVQDNLVDSIFRSMKLDRVDSFVVENGNWFRILNTKKLPFILFNEIQEQGSAKGIDRDGKTKLSFQKVDQRMGPLGLKVYVLNLFSGYEGNWEYLGQVYFNSEFGIVATEYQYQSKIQLRIIEELF